MTLLRCITSLKLSLFPQDTWIYRVKENTVPFLGLLSGWVYYPAEFYVVLFNKMPREKLGILSGGLLTDVYCIP